jgi:hypothetical protein
MTSSRDLRANAAQLRAGSTMFAPRPVATPPADLGVRLATLERGESEQVRVTWAEYEGRPFLNIRLWTRNAEGQWWPDKKGIAIKVRELPAFADGIAGALELLEQRDAGA